MNATQTQNHQEPKPTKHETVQSWENEGGAVPEKHIFQKEPPSFWKSLPVRAHATRRKLAKAMKKNPEIGLAAAVGVGFLVGSRARAFPLLKALLGFAATTSVQRLLAKVQPGAAESI